jgi:TonB-linked SusC/RagA family outer membrane protein
MRRLACLYAALSMLLLLAYPSFAQERTITGRIISDDNIPLVGVTVTNTSTNKKVLTNESGEFRIAAQRGQKLTFVYVGFQKQTITVGDAAVINVKLTGEGNQLEEVTVAMDMKRNPRELGFSTQKVAGSEVQETQRENFFNSLQGRVAGLTVNSTSGQAGASSAIVLRGFNSMALDNQPLFVIDGIVVDNQSFNQNSNSGSGLGLVENSSRNVNQTSNRVNDYSNRMADLNPNDIESITILKGPEATALYGSQASSGAIIITTKKGVKDGKLKVAYDNSFRLQELTRLPKIQNAYGNGFNGLTTSEFRYLGPQYPSGTKIYDNMDEFFQTGFAQTHNLSAEYGKKNYSFRASGSFFDQSGVVPENRFTRYTFRLSNSTRINKYVDIMPAVSFTRSTNDKPMRGVNGFMLNLLQWPNNFDASNWENESGGKKLLFASSANGEIDNPYFSVNRNRSRDETSRYTATFGINITPLSWLTLSGRFGYDTYESEGYSLYHPLSFWLTKGTGGSQDNYYRKYKGYNHTITAVAKKKIGKFGTRITVGTMWQDYRTESYSVYGTNIVDSVNTAGEMVRNGVVVTQQQFESLIGDSSATRSTSRERLNNARRYGTPNYMLNRQLAYFGEASISFNNMIFLSYSHRFETSSIFPKDFRDYDYPAGSLSIIMSDLIPGLKKGKILNYWKLRTSLASTARAPIPYLNQSVFNLVSSSGGGFAYGFNNNNVFMEPEIQKTYEVGTEIRVLNNLFNLDITYYNTLCDKQIAENFRTSYGTGFVLNTLNVGTTRNQGVEISISTTPIKKRDFSWDIRLNFNRMWNKVLSLPGNVPEFYISDTWVFQNARGGLVKGGPTTSITAFGYARNNKGQILIDPTSGLPVNDGLFLSRGDRNPDFTLGTVNSLRYKNWRLNMVWDLKIGGDVFNGTEMYLTNIGKSLRTIDRETPRVINGVLKDGKENTDNPTINTISVIPYYQSAYYSYTNMPEESYIEKDVNALRLRDITLSYALTGKKLAALRHFKSFSLFITGNDLILISNYRGADPAVSGNTAGTRGVGGWGFDFGNVGTPVGVNFGFKAGF